LRASPHDRERGLEEAVAMAEPLLLATPITVQIVRFLQNRSVVVALPEKIEAIGQLAHALPMATDYEDLLTAQE
tara:strand:- start:97 stop:318 length:222 start_codon:yes stop_codon:yes gene_type:complete